MELRQLKKEVHALPHIGKQVEQFLDSWIRPLRSNTNSHLPFLQDLDPATKKELNQKLTLVQQHLAGLKSSQVIHEKMQQYARYLIELKLSSFNGDTRKSKFLRSSLTKDQFLNNTELRGEIVRYEEHLERLQVHYDGINELLQKRLSLEEMLFYMELPHRIYLQNLLKLAKQQKAVARNLERHFQAITLEMSMKNVPQR